MQVVYDPRHVLHDPLTEVQYGVPLPMYEVPSRVESIRTSLSADPAFTFTSPVDHGLEPVTAVHEEGLIRFLAEAWSLWRADGGGGGSMPPQLVPDTIVHPAMREGMGPPLSPRVPSAGSATGAGTR
jgi:acetoin utilization deacetylase AcuC-like enzyme